MKQFAGKGHTLPSPTARRPYLSETRSPVRPRRVLLVASGGGHWVQLLRLKAAWQGADVAYLTVQPSYRSEVPDARFYSVRDATRWDRWRLLMMVMQVTLVVLRERPEVLITSGAAPGLVALRVAKWLGARTVWLDSIANVEEMSMAGRRATGVADLQLTQWQHLAVDDGPVYRGSVL